MRRARRLEAVAAVLLVCVPPAGAARVERLKGLRGAAAGVEVEVAAEELVVRFDPAASAAQRAAALAAAGARVIGELPQLGWTHLALPPGQSVGPALAVLRVQPGVLQVEPNYAFRPIRVPSDPLINSQYHLSRVSAYAAWDYEVGTSSRVTIAIIDAGIQGTHPDLSAKFDPGNVPNQVCTGASCSPEAGGVADFACNHGTRVAGIAAAVTDNGSMVAGLSWGARLLSLRVFDKTDCLDDCGDEGGNDCVTFDVRVASAIVHATNLQGRAEVGNVIINMSLGQAGASCPSVVQAAINAAELAQVLVVAAAGNSGPGSNTINQPGNCVSVLPVGATDSNDNIASFSSRGPELANNGVVAPGVNIVTTDIGGTTTGSATGTSFSAPLVAGLAAIIRSAKPTFTPAQVRSTLRSSTVGIGVAGLGAAASEPLGNSSGSGRVDAFRAARLAVTGTLAGFEGDQKAIAFPNPFRPSQHGAVTITIPTSLQGRNPEIKVYTQDGQLVRELSGQSWDGKNDGGKAVASGVYIFTVKTDNGLQKGRVAVLR